jgi:MscS family membrane protein
VRFNNFGESSLDILVMFHLQVEDYATELREREVVLLQIMDLVRDAGVEFAFPTRTLQVANPTEKMTTRPTPNGSVIDLVRRPDTT